MKGWTVVIEDMADAVGEKRGGRVGMIFGRLLPKGNSRESFAGTKAHSLDNARIAELSRFVEQGQKVLGVPGVALGLLQDGKVIFADGFGVKWGHAEPHGLRMPSLRRKAPRAMPHPHRQGNA